MKNIKILQLVTVILFALIILITIIGLYLIWFSNFDFKFNDKCNSTFKDGYVILKHFGLSYVLNHSASYICSLSEHTINYYPWIQLQAEVILCIIIGPTLLYMTILFITIIFILQIKNRNNNFWDSLQNCEIINNYYIH